jgi:hypothetical protein
MSHRNFKLLYLILIHFTTYLTLPATKLTLLQQECELEGINAGTRLADRYNSFDEHCDWDTRMHHDYLVKHLGFAGWIEAGLWKNTHLTALKNDAPHVHRVSLIRISHIIYSNIQVYPSIRYKVII